MNTPAVQPSESVDEQHPWPGLLPFSEENRAFFHGRDAEAAELLRLIRREPLTVLFGQSGLGKSSLLGAGLFPLLRRDDFFPVYIRLDVAPAAPVLAAQVKAVLAANLAMHRVDAPAPRDEETLWAYFHRIDNDFWSSRNRLLTPVLVFDQFEEIFTLGRHDPQLRARCEAFITELGDLIENRTPAAVERSLEDNPDLAATLDFSRRNCKVLLAFREDFLPEFEGLRRDIRSIMQNRMRLTRMNGVQALEAVTQSGGRLIAPGVAAQIIEFVAGPRARGREHDEIEPALLSLVCRELNNKRLAAARATITADLLEAGAQQEIISSFYERSIGDLDPAVRVFVEDQLLTEAGYRDSYALEDALRLPDLTREAIDTLVTRRLLRLEERFGVLRIEITHDVLTRVIRDSRDQRQVREAEAARAAREEERRRRSRRMLGWGVTAGAAVLGLAVVFGVLMQRAIAEKNRVVETQSSVLVTQANASLDSRTPRDSFAYLARALRLHPGNEAAAARAATLLHQRVYPDLTGERSLPEQLGRARLSWLDGERVAAGSRLISASDPFRVWKLVSMPEQPALLLRRVEAARMGFTRESKLTDEPRHDPALGVLLHADTRETRIYDAASLRQLSTFDTRGAGAIRAVSRGGKLFAYQSQDQKITVWRAGGSAPVTELAAPAAFASRLTALEFAPDGASVLAWSEDGSAALFDSTTGAQLWTQKIARGAVVPEGGSFSINGRWLIVVANHIVRLHDVQTGAPHGKDMVHAAPVNAVSYSADGEHLATACQDQAARLWHVDSASLAAPLLMHDGPVTSVRFSASKRHVLTASLDGTARVFRFTGSEAVEPLLHDTPVVAAEFSPDGERVATLTAHGHLMLWRPRLDQSTRLTLEQGAPVTAMAVSGDGLRLATATDRGAVLVWKVAQQTAAGAAPVTLERQFSAHAERITAMAFDAGGALLATAAADGTARVWDAAKGEAVGAPLRHQGAVRSLRFSADAQWLLSTADDLSARLWNVRQSAMRGLAMRHGAPVTQAELSRDGRIVVTASGAEARIWDAATGALLTRLRHEAPVTSLSLHPEARELVTASGKKIALWQVAPGNHVTRLRDKEDAFREARNLVWGVRYSHDGTRIAAAGLDGFVQIWARDGLLPVGTPMKHNALVTQMTFSHDNRWLTTEARDRGVRVWDVRSGQLVADPLAHDYDVSGAAAIANHAWMATAAMDGKLHLWRLGMNFREMPPQWVAPGVEAFGGARIDDSGAMVLLDRRAERLAHWEAQLKNHANNDFWRNWAREIRRPFTRPLPAGQPPGRL